MYLLTVFFNIFGEITNYPKIIFREICSNSDFLTVTLDVRKLNAAKSRKGKSVSRKLKLCVLVFSYTEYLHVKGISEHLRESLIVFGKD